MTLTKYILVLTISSTEFKAVHSHLENSSNLELAIPSGSKMEGVSARIGSQNGYSIIVICSYGSGNRILGPLSNAIHKYNPALVLFVGIGGGVKSSEISIGTVVISDYIADHSSAVEKDGRTLYEVKGGPIHPRLLPLLSEFKNNTEWIKRIRPLAIEAKEETKTNFVIGKIVAGNVRVEGLEGPLAETLKDDAKAIEMESASCYGLVTQMNDIPYLAIRGVSDFMSDKTSETDLYRQPIAAAHASALAFELIEKFIQKNSELDLVSDQVTALEEGADIEEDAVENDSEKLELNVSSINMWNQIAIIHNFVKRPKRHRGTSLNLQVSFTGPSQRASEDACTAMGLDFGDAIETSIQIVKPEIKANAELSFLRKVYAQSNAADWLEINSRDREKTFLISVRLEFGSYMERSEKWSPFTFSDLNTFSLNLADRLRPNNDKKQRESVCYLSGLILESGETIEKAGTSRIAE